MDDIRISSFHAYRTYEGCLAGWPPPKECVRAARAKASSIFPGHGHVPLLVLEPETIVSEASRTGRQPPLIPQWCHIAWLDGPAPDPEDDGSHLIAVWFASELSLDIQSIVPRLDWSKNSKGFGF